MNRENETKSRRGRFARTWIDDVVDPPSKERDARKDADIRHIASGSAKRRDADDDDDIAVDVARTRRRIESNDERRADDETVAIARRRHVGADVAIGMIRAGAKGDRRLLDSDARARIHVARSSRARPRVRDRLRVAQRLERGGRGTFEADEGGVRTIAVVVRVARMEEDCARAYAQALRLRRDDVGGHVARLGLFAQVFEARGACENVARRDESAVAVRYAARAGSDGDMDDRCGAGELDERPDGEESNSIHQLEARSVRRVVEAAVL